MGEKQTTGNNPKTVELTIKTDGPLSQPETKPFNGFVVNGVFMAPRPELTPEQKKDLGEKINNIVLHRS